MLFVNQTYPMNPLMMEICKIHHKIALNVTKTYSKLVSTKQKHEIIERQNKELNLKISNKEIDVVQTTRYLGLQIDSSLDWRRKAKQCSTKVSRTVGILKYSKSLLCI